MAKANRRSRRQYTARPTPPHVVRLTRIRVELDPTRKWYVLRTPSRREREVERGLQSAGFATYRPFQQTYAERARGAVEIEGRELPGHVFAGALEAQDGLLAIWAWHDAACRPLPPMRFLRPDGTMGEIPAGKPGNQLIFDVIGPLDVAGLQQFVDRVGERAVAVLYERGRPVFVFPSGAARMSEQEATWMEAA